MNSRIYKFICFIILSGILSGCEVVPPKSKVTIDRIGEAIMDDTEIHTEEAEEEMPADVAAALLPEVSIEIPEISTLEDSTEQRFDVATAEMPAQEFFMSLAEGTPYSMIVHPKVEGEITLNLKNASLSETMEVVKEVYGYDYKYSNNNYMVFPREIQTRVFSVSYLNVKRTGASDMRVTSGQLTQTGDTSNTSATDTSDSSSDTQNTVTGTVINTTSESDFWNDLKTGLESLIGEEEGRRVVVNPASGLVMVKAMPNELRSVDEFLTKIQSIVGRQVILEAKILEVTLNDGYQSGINWAALGDPEDAGNLVAGQIGGGSILSGSGVSDIQGNGGVLDPRNLSEVDGTDLTAFGGMFTLALNLNEFNAFIELLETQGNVQVLSSPRVSTVNNQKAVIKVGSDEYFVTEVENTTTTTAATSQNNPTVKLTPFFSGIALDVTPQISEEGSVTLHIHPSVSQVEDQTKSFTVGDDTFSLPLAFSSTRESDSVIKASNGQIVVIGGLMKDETSESIASVPILGDIPFIGSIFRHTRQVSEKSELVILLRPIVVESDQDWVMARQESLDRVSELNRGFHLGGKVEVFGTMGETKE